MSYSDGSSMSVEGAQQAALSSRIQFSLYAKQLQVARQEGAAVASLLEGALNLAKEAGKGESLDLQV